MSAKAKHKDIEITISDAPVGVRDAVTQEDTATTKTLKAHVQVDKDDNLVHVCDGDQYRKFFEAYGSVLEYKMVVSEEVRTFAACPHHPLMTRAR